jgi:hypothetical protein
VTAPVLAGNGKGQLFGEAQCSEHLIVFIVNITPNFADRTERGGLCHTGEARHKPLRGVRFRQELLVMRF